jgi:hypothetical protein
LKTILLTSAPKPAAGIILANPILTPVEANISMTALRQFIVSNLTGGFTMTVEPNYKTFFDNYIGALIHIVSRSDGPQIGVADIVVCSLWVSR